ncbi:MAG TPA: SWIM zinc finger family protein [Acetobacteraceae bacterium]
MARWNSRHQNRYEDRWPAYVPVAERRRKAEVEMAKLSKKGHPVSPVKIEGRAIATTFWGKAWCDNLESYRDYANRIERGRTYVRNGSVVDLQIAPREVKAMVSGSNLYNVTIKIDEVPKHDWTSICKDCAGGIDSLVELLQGRFSKGVMERICRQGTGLFPKPAEIHMSCSCPDYAYMCKHIAAVLYGIGARLDAKPELLFRLRAVDENDLVARIGDALPLAKRAPASGKVLQSDDVSALFGLDMAEGEAPAAAEVLPKAARAGRKVAAQPLAKAPAKAAAKPVAPATPKPTVLRKATQTVSGKVKLPMAKVVVPRRKLKDASRPRKMAEAAD